MWRNVGIEREADGLHYAMDSISFWSGYVLDAEFDEPGGWELQNMLQLGGLMAWAALKRRESRGVRQHRLRRLAAGSHGRFGQMDRQPRLQNRGERRDRQ